MQQVKNATGMSASQMNSEKELQLAMDMIGKENGTYESSQDAVNALSKFYGTGDIVYPERFKQKVPQQNQGWSSVEVNP